MLDGLLGRGFASKCKSLIKLTKSRIDVLRRKRNATQKFLKKDVADLLSNGLDINAYGRAEVLLAELNLSYCYDLVEQSCDFVLKHLSVIQKLSDCPEDCREAVSSMMFAAARFSDLPELRDLRQIFQERYGNSLEYFVNHELVEKLTSKPSTMEKKVQLMQDLASEFSIKWDARAFQQRMTKPSTSAKDQPKSYGSFNVANDKYKSINGKDTIPNSDKDAVSYKDGIERTSVGHRLDNALASDGLKPLNGREESVLKMDKRDFSRQGRQEVVDDKHRTSDGMGDTAFKTVSVVGSAYANKIEYKGRQNAVPKREIKDGLPYGNPSIAPGYGKIQEEETPKLNPNYKNALPPPYVKSNVKSKDSNGVVGVSKDSSLNVRDASESIQAGSVHRQHEKQIIGYTELYYKDDNVAFNPIPKPRSVRRRHGKAPRDDNVGDVGVVKRKSRSRRRDDSKRGLQILVDDEHSMNDNNEEERIIDKLLMHYSKKPSTYEEGTVRRKSKTRPTEMVPAPARSISLPPERQTASSETMKIFDRAASFQPDRSNAARHVHPKLPDYDDLAAQFAALKRR